MNANLPEGEALVLQLDFPAEWRQPRNPLAEPAAAWARTYVGDFGLAGDGRLEKRLDEFDPAGGSWPFYAAERPLLYTVTAFLAVSHLFREQRAGQAADAFGEAALVSAVRGEGTRPEDPFAAAFWELGQRYAKKLSRTFLFRHGERFRAWLRALAKPAEAVTLESWLESQRQAAGILPALDFLELDLGEELAPTVWNDPRMSTLERLAAEIVALQRDLADFARSAEPATNVVRIVQRETGLEAGAAFQRVVRRHNEKVEELDRTGRAMLREHRATALAAWWIRLCGLVAGFGRWFAEAARRGPHALGGRSLRLSLEDLDEDDCEEQAVTTGVWKLPQLLTLIAAVPAAG